VCLFEDEDTSLRRLFSRVCRTLYRLGEYLNLGNCVTVFEDASLWRLFLGGGGEVSYLKGKSVLEHRKEQAQTVDLL
jgi:hypothetical protein